MLWPSWLYILNFKLTPNIKLFKESIMLQYHLRIIYINLSLLSNTVLWNNLKYPFVMLGYLRHKLPQLLYLWEIKCLWLYVISLEWEITLKTSAWCEINHFIHLSFVIESLNTMPNMDQLQNWNWSIGNPTPWLITIFINMNHIPEEPITIALRKFQQSSNNIYLKYYLLSI